MTPTPLELAPGVEQSISNPELIQRIDQDLKNLEDRRKAGEMLGTIAKANQKLPELIRKDMPTAPLSETEYAAYRQKFSAGGLADPNYAWNKNGVFRDREGMAPEETAALKELRKELQKMCMWNRSTELPPYLKRRGRQLGREALVREISLAVTENPHLTEDQKADLSVALMEAWELSESQGTPAAMLLAASRTEVLQKVIGTDRRARNELAQEMNTGSEGKLSDVVQSLVGDEYEMTEVKVLVGGGYMTYGKADGMLNLDVLTKNFEIRNAVRRTTPDGEECIVFLMKNGCKGNPGVVKLGKKTGGDIPGTITEEPGKTPFMIIEPEEDEGRIKETDDSSTDEPSESSVDELGEPLSDIPGESTVDELGEPLSKVPDESPVDEADKSSTDVPGESPVDEPEESTVEEESDQSSVDDHWLKVTPERTPEEIEMAKGKLLEEVKNKMEELIVNQEETIDWDGWPLIDDDVFYFTPKQGIRVSLSNDPNGEIVLSKERLEEENIPPEEMVKYLLENVDAIKRDLELPEQPGSPDSAADTNVETGDTVGETEAEVEDTSEDTGNTGEETGDTGGEIDDSSADTGSVGEGEGEPTVEEGPESSKPKTLKEDGGILPDWAFDNWFPFEIPDWEDIDPDVIKFWKDADEETTPEAPQAEKGVIEEGTDIIKGLIEKGKKFAEEAAPSPEPEAEPAPEAPAAEPSTDLNAPPPPPSGTFSSEPAGQE